MKREWEFRAGSWFLCSYLVSFFTFLDHRHMWDMATVVSGHGHVGHVHLWWGQHGGGAHGGVVEDGRAVALPAAFPPVAVDSCLKLSGGAQSPLFTFIRVEVLHIPAGRKTPTIHQAFCLILSIKSIGFRRLGVGQEGKKAPEWPLKLHDD